MTTTTHKTQFPPEKISMLDLCNPLGGVSSTLALNFSILGEHKAFSLPPFLYYAQKARQLTLLGFSSEDEAKEKNIDVKQHVFQEIRDVARKVFSEALAANIDPSDLSGYMSGMVQDAMLTKLLHDAEFQQKNEFAAHKSISVNATRAKKNITIMNYLMTRLLRLYGSRLAVSSQINLIAIKIKEQLQFAQMINETGDITGPAANSSWSRKVHNQIFLSLCQMTPEFQALSGWEEVMMNRDIELETTYKRGCMVTQ